MFTEGATTRATKGAGVARLTATGAITTSRVSTGRGVARLFATADTWNPDAYAPAAEPTAISVDLDGVAATIDLDGEAVTIGDPMKSGDLEPPWRIRVGDARRRADLHGVTSWRMVAMRADTTVVVDDPTPLVRVDPDGDGSTWIADVDHRWAAGETDVPAGEQRIRLYGEVEAYWPGSPTRPQTFDGKRHATIDIFADVG